MDVDDLWQTVQLGPLIEQYTQCLTSQFCPVVVGEAGRIECSGISHRVGDRHHEGHNQTEVEEKEDDDYGQPMAGDLHVVASENIETRLLPLKLIMIYVAEI